MILSIVFPFAISDAQNPQNRMMHNLIMYLGITKTVNDMKGRSKAKLMISAGENIPQFIVVVMEMVQIRKSINFVQAGNPLFGIAMIYKAVGPFIGFMLYVISLHWQFELIIFTVILIFVMATPQLFIDLMLNQNYLSQDQIPEIYF